MRKWLLPAAVGALTLAAGGAAMAQPYGYYGGHRGGYYDRGYDGYGYGYRDYRGYRRDSDRDGVPDRVEWGRDRDRDGRPDQWDRHDNRRHHHHRSYYGYRYGYRY